MFEMRLVILSYPHKHNWRNQENQDMWVFFVSLSWVSGGVIWENGAYQEWWFRRPIFRIFLWLLAGHACLHFHQECWWFPLHLLWTLPEFFFHTKRDEINKLSWFFCYHIWSHNQVLPLLKNACGKIRKSCQEGGHDYMKQRWIKIGARSKRWMKEARTLKGYAKLPRCRPLNKPLKLFRLREAFGLLIELKERLWVLARRKEETIFRTTWAKKERGGSII